MRVNRKAYVEDSTGEPAAVPTSKSVAPALANSLSASNRSPARDLQHRLNDMFATQTYISDPDDHRLPFKWTLLALALICGSFWALIASLIF